MPSTQTTESGATEAKEVAQQAEAELAILLGIKQSLQFAIKWVTRDRGNGHKLSTLRFAMRSFERHLTRTRILADHGGYMHSITKANPHLASDITALRGARQELQVAFERILLHLEYVSPDDANALEEMCGELVCYLEQLEVHSQKEMELLQHSFVQEYGGEG